MFKIAFQGEKGAFSEDAAYRYWGEDLETIPKTKFKAVFDAVENGECDFGIVPVENSLTGSIHENVDLLLERHLYISAEIMFHIEHNLLAMQGTSLNDIRKIYSHPQALSQCGNFLETLSNAETVPALDTAGSARMVSEAGETGSAAIAGARAAKTYGLEIIAENIENNHENYTRFVILSKKKGRICGKCKTSVVLALQDEPGALGHCLAFFAERGINLVKLESRPVLGSPWKYYFYLDFIGDADEKKCHDALIDLEEMAVFFKMLGTYHRWEENQE